MKEEKLLSLLQKKKGFFDAILDLSEDELDLPLDDWIAVLEQKKILLTCIDEVDESLLPYNYSLSHISQEVTDELDAIKKTIQKILHIDMCNQKNRKQRLKNL